MFYKIIIILFPVYVSCALQIDKDTLFLERSNIFNISNDSGDSITIDSVVLKVPPQFQSSSLAVGGYIGSSYSIGLLNNLPMCIPQPGKTLLIPPQRQYQATIFLYNCCYCPIGKQLAKRNAAGEVMFDLLFLTRTDTGKITVVGTPLSGAIEKAAGVFTSGLSVSPNPANSGFLVSAGDKWKGASIRLVNPRGQRILMLRRMAGARVKLDAGALRPGVYFIILEKGKDFISKKLAVVK